MIVYFLMMMTLNDDDCVTFDDDGIDTLDDDDCFFLVSTKPRSLQSSLI